MDLQLLNWDFNFLNENLKELDEVGYNYIQNQFVLKFQGMSLIIKKCLVTFWQPKDASNNRKQHNSINEVRKRLMYDIPDA